MKKLIKKKLTKKKYVKVAPADQNASGEKADTPNDIGGRDLLLCLVVFLSVFAFVGYLRGQSVRNQPERLRLDVIPKLVLAERSGRKILAFQCNGKQEIAWDVDKDELFNERILIGSPEAPSYRPAILDNSALTTAFVASGGAASVFSAKEIFAFSTKPGATSKLTRNRHVQLIIVALLATVSGYEIGYQIALRSNSDCNDARFTKVLNERKHWIGDDQDWGGFEKIYWGLSLQSIREQEHLGSCNSADANVKDLQEKKFALARAEFIAFLEGPVTSQKHNISAADYEALDKYWVVLREFNERCST